MVDERRSKLRVDRLGLPGDGRPMSAGQPLTDEKQTRERWANGDGLAKASLGMVRGGLCLTGDGRRIKRECLVLTTVRVFL